MSWGVVEGKVEGGGEGVDMMDGMIWFESEIREAHLKRIGIMNSAL